MIVMTLCNLFYNVVTTLLNFINLPNLSQDVSDSIWDFIILAFDYGDALFGFFVPHHLMTIGLPTVAVILAFKYGYYLIMWILKKIPMVGIE